jgi:tRNA(fMet)-specific endonuclease VapC
MAEELLLDTSPLVAHLRAQLDLHQLVPAETVFFTSLFTVAELSMGIHRASRPETERVKVQAFLEEVTILMPSGKTAEIYGQVAAALEQKGHRIPINDIWIAAMALEAGMPLATGDDHFSRVTGLELVQWTW